jgi:hypothetical protein
MTKEEQETKRAPGSGYKHSTQTTELDRINSKLERLSAQRKALRKAMDQFGGNFDAKIWAAAFDSADADDINRVFTVTGGYLALVNNTAEAIKTGVRLAGLKPTSSMPGIPGVLDALRADGGLTAAQARTFTELYRTRNRLQHSSPDIQADEVHAQVRLLLNHLPRFLKSYLAWLEKHDIWV